MAVQLDGGSRAEPRPGEGQALVEPVWPDRAALIARFAGDQELFEEVATIFLEDHPRMLGQLRAACDAGNLTALRAAAHAIKGAVSHFTSGAAYEAVARLERLAEAGHMDAFANVREVERLVAAFVAVVAAHTSHVGRTD